MSKEDNSDTNQTFEDLRVWQEAKKLTKEVYAEFGDSNDFGFRDQTQRAALSVMNNIAEGYERDTQKDLRRFLYIAKGSSGEVRSMLILAEELGYISEGKQKKLHERCIKISKMLSAFINQVNP